MTPTSAVERHQCFGGIFCYHLQGRRVRRPEIREYVYGYRKNSNGNIPPPPHQTARTMECAVLVTEKFYERTQS
jgi:hypothetical protein